MKTLLNIMTFVFMLDVLTAQTIIHVPADQPTIKAGINSAIDGDTVLVADGTYIGDDGGLYGKDIVVKSQNGPLNCIIDGQGTGYVGFGDGYSYEGLNTVIEGFTVRNFFGRGFYFYGGACPTIKNNIIESCGGGGITFSGGSPVIENNVIQNNEGPGIECSSSTARIISNTIRENRADNGAGISLSGSAATIMNNIIYENSSEKGGGLYCSNSSSATIINNTIIDNVAILGCDVYIDESPIILTNNIIAFSKYKPSHIYIYNFESHGNYEGAKLSSIDYTFVLAKQGDSGLVNFLSTSSFGGKNIDSTFQMSAGERRTVYINSKVNEYGDFGGIRLVITHNNDTLVVKADGPSSYRPGSYYLTLAMDSDAIPASIEIVEIGQGSEITYCDIFGNLEGNYYSGTSDSELKKIVLDGTNGNISLDPLFVDPEHGDYHLQQGSPCIDMGTSDISGIQLPETDVYGNERILDGDENGSFIIDIGACEYDNTTGVKINRKAKKAFELHQNYPNPFNSLTKIRFNVANAGNARLIIYNLVGQKIRELTNPNSANEFIWDGTDQNGEVVSSGIFIYELKGNDFSASRKLILVK